MALVRRIARPLLAAPFVFGGINQLRSAGALAPVAQPVTDKVAPLAKLPNDPELLVRVNGAAMVAGGALLAIGRMPRTASLLLSGLLVPTTIAGHAFWATDDPKEKQEHIIAFVSNLGLLGGLLVASGDTEGRPGLAYRAGMAKDAAGRAADSAKLSGKLKLAEAKLAAHNVTNS